jgi:hypothetical protein
LPVATALTTPVIIPADCVIIVVTKSSGLARQWVDRNSTRIVSSQLTADSYERLLSLFGAAGIANANEEWR